MMLETCLERKGGSPFNMKIIQGNQLLEVRRLKLLSTTTLLNENNYNLKHK